MRNVGDKVKIRSKEWILENTRFSSSGCGYYHPSSDLLFNKEMLVYCGQEFTIIQLLSCVERYELNLNGHGAWLWEDWMFEDEPSDPAIVMEKIIEILSDHQMHEISEKAPDIIMGQMQLKVKGVYLNKNNDIMFIYYGGDYPLHVNDRIATYILYLLLMNHIVKSFNIEQIYDTHRR